jgi:hypothetical protein
MSTSAQQLRQMGHTCALRDVATAEVLECSGFQRYDLEGFRSFYGAESKLLA